MTVLFDYHYNKLYLNHSRNIIVLVRGGWDWSLIIMSINKYNAKPMTSSTCERKWMFPCNTKVLCFFIILNITVAHKLMFFIVAVPVDKWALQMNLMFTNLFVFLSHRHPVNQPWPSSSSVSWLTTSGSWWRACTCRHCSLSHLSSRRNTSGGTYLLAGVGTSLVIIPVYHMSLFPFIWFPVFPLAPL